MNRHNKGAAPGGAAPVRPECLRDITLRPGDECCVENYGIVATGIDIAQKFNSKDNESTYTHAFLLTDRHGSTLEACKTVCRQNMFEVYRGRKIIIARPMMDLAGNNITRKQILAALEVLAAEHEGQVYPFWRIPLHIIPPLAKYVSWGGRFLVCSELTAKNAYLVGARHGQFAGATPDDRADEYRRWKNYRVLYEGVLE